MKAKISIFKALCASELVMSFIVLSWNWSQITRRLPMVAAQIVVNYAIASFVLLFVVRIFNTKNESGLLNVILVAVFIPYLAAIFAYFSEEIPMWNSFGHYPELSSIFFVGMFAPYLVLWGPVVSIVNLVVVLLGKYFNEKAYL